MKALPSVLRPLLYLVLGASLPPAAGRLATALAGAWRPGPAAVWVCDRDGGRLVSLDRALFERAAATLAAPVAVAALEDGGAWALDALERRPGGPHRLVRVDAEGRVRAERLLAGPAQLAARGSDAVLASAGGTGRLRVVDPAGAVALERALPAGLVPTALAARGERALVGFADGSLSAFDLADGALVAVAAGAAPVTALAPGPRGGWWTLAGAPLPSLALRGADLVPRWEQPMPARADGLAPVPGAERAWLVSSAGDAPLLVGSRGRIEAALDRPPRSGLRGAAASRSGGVLVASPGAVIELDRDGVPRRAQGGFDFLVGLARVPP